MKSLREQIEQTIRRRKLLRKRERILVAVSGGLDSMVLLHLLQQLAPDFGWRLCVAHFNHQLRGRASEADERFVRKAAATLGLPVRIGRGAVSSVAKQQGLSLEMAARELRHKFLAQAARRLKCRTIAVAHHADDQVELFLLRLLRGAGGDGLAGMKWQSVSPADQRLQIVRPLLDLTKETLEQHARAEQIRHREDVSNASGDMLRNRLRHELLPLLRRRFQPALNRTILRLMDIVGADAEVVNEAARSWLKAKDPAQRLAEQAVGLQRRVIQLQLQHQRIEADFDLIELLRSSPGRPVTVAANLRIRCDDRGRVSRVVAAPASFQRGRKVLWLIGATGDSSFDGASIIWRKRTQRGMDLPKHFLGELFDADQVGSTIVLRHWQAGDRFQPIGLGAAVKLQDWFTNRKIPAGLRRRLIVATTARGEIFWIEGQRIGERFKLTPDTRHRLDWRWERAQTT